MRIYLKGKEEEEEAFNHSTQTHEGRTAYEEIPFHFPVDICLSFQFRTLYSLDADGRETLKALSILSHFSATPLFSSGFTQNRVQSLFFFLYGGRGMEGHVPWNMPGDFLQHKSPEEDVPAKGRFLLFSSLPFFLPVLVVIYVWGGRPPLAVAPPPPPSIFPLTLLPSLAAFTGLPKNAYHRPPKRAFKIQHFLRFSSLWGNPVIRFLSPFFPSSSHLGIEGEPTLLRRQKGKEERHKQHRLEFAANIWSKNI